MVQDLTVTGPNYDSAIQLLKQRFGSPQQIISAHMEGLLKVTNHTGDRLGSLCAVYDKNNSSCQRTGDTGCYFRAIRNFPNTSNNN